MDDIIDFVSLSDEELKTLIGELTAEELEVSRRRRILHGQLDILRAELVLRLQHHREAGESIITAADVSRLSEILAGKQAVSEVADDQPDDPTAAGD